MDDSSFSASPQTSPKDVGPTGLGGWLIAAVAMLSLACLWLSYLLAFQYPVVFATHWTDSSQLFKTAFVIRVIADFILVTLGVSLLDMYFSRSRLFPKFYIGWIVGLGSVMLLMDQLAYFDPAMIEIGGNPNHGASRGAFAAVCVWLPYLLTARRVRNTFTR